VAKGKDLEPCWKNRSSPVCLCKNLQSDRRWTVQNGFKQLSCGTADPDFPGPAAIDVHCSKLEGLAIARSWGFESPLPHQHLTMISLTERDAAARASISSRAGKVCSGPAVYWRRLHVTASAIHARRACRAVPVSLDQHPRAPAEIIHDSPSAVIVTIEYRPPS
jgi:hypothetical protein